MEDTQKHIIAVILPSYKVKGHIKEVVETIPDFIDHIIVVDDKCPEGSGKYIEHCFAGNERVKIIYHDVNKGVGGAVISGYKLALELNVDIAVKMDGDGQMDPQYLKQLIGPIIQNKADYTKGNRFYDFKALKKMPKIRLLGNSILSFLLKVASGYWNIMDPTNGFTAINKEAIESLNFDRISNRYFFESDMLINLNICNKVVKDVNIPAFYGNEKSSMNIKSIALKFPLLLCRRFFKRILLKYFVYDFNMASVYTLVGLPMLLFGAGFGIYRWVYGVMHGIENSTGTVMLSVLPLILGVQFILQAISIDINSVPKK